MNSDIDKDLSYINDDRYDHREKGMENDELIIEENTIYEIDLECYECLMKAKRKKAHQEKSAD